MMEEEEKSWRVRNSKGKQKKTKRWFSIKMTVDQEFQKGDDQQKHIYQKSQEDVREKDLVCLQLRELPMR